MKPLEAGYGDTGFMFSFEAIYNFGEGIANLGTYIPASTVQPDTNAEGNASYSLVPWFRHGVTPTAPPAWCGGWIIAKDSYNVCGFSPESKQYFLLEVKSGAPSFGQARRHVLEHRQHHASGRIAAVLLRARLGTGLAALQPRTRPASAGRSDYETIARLPSPRARRASQPSLGARLRTRRQSANLRSCSPTSRSGNQLYRSGSDEVRVLAVQK